MKFLVVVAALGFASIATAQANASNSTSLPPTSTSVSASPEQTCLANCARTDICCQAACVNVPCPSQSQANATTECAMQCPQGNGSAADTQNYASCQSSCISSLFFSTTGAATVTGTGASNAASTTGTAINSSASGTGATASSGRAASTTSTTGAASTSSGAASKALIDASFGAGIFGLLITGLAF